MLQVREGKIKNVHTLWFNTTPRTITPLTYTPPPYFLLFCLPHKETFLLLPCPWPGMVIERGMGGGNKKSKTFREIRLRGRYTSLFSAYSPKGEGEMQFSLERKMRIFFFQCTSEFLFSHTLFICNSISILSKLSSIRKGSHVTCIRKEFMWHIWSLGQGAAASSRGFLPHSN